MDPILKGKQSKKNDRLSQNVANYPSTPHKVPEEWISNLHRGRSLNSGIIIIIIIIIVVVVVVVVVWSTTKCCRCISAVNIPCVQLYNFNCLQHSIS